MLNYIFIGYAWPILFWRLTLYYYIVGGIPQLKSKIYIYVFNERLYLLSSALFGTVKRNNVQWKYCVKIYI